MQKAECVERALGLLGPATRAGRVTVGVPLICAALQKSKPGKGVSLVLMAAEASAATQKKIGDKCAFYGVRLIPLSTDCGRLALAVGKRDGLVAAVGVSDPGLADAIAAALKED